MESKQIYEIGFLFVPAIAEEALNAKFSALKEVLEKAGASFISEEFPKMRQLAYKISKRKDESKKESFDRGYFGWVKFELSPEAIASVEAEFAKNIEIIRFLTVKTVRENTIVPIVPKAVPLAKEEEVPAHTAEEEKEIDESIDELVIE